MLSSEQKNWRLHPESIFRTTAHKYFTIPEPLFTISCPEEDTNYLRAISICLNSYISDYYNFFKSTQWGVDRNSIFIQDIRTIAVPALSTNQIVEISKLQQEPYMSEIGTVAQERLDKEIGRILNIPRNISIIAKDFINVRCTLNKNKAIIATQPSAEHHLLEYGECLARELDEFVEGSGTRHKISIVNSNSFTICTVEIAKSSSPIDITVTIVTNNNNYYYLLGNIQQEPRYKFNQWVYTQCGIYIFDGAKIHICKASRLIDWTQTQALNDSDDIIAQVLTTKNQNNEALLEGSGITN
ncbi:hypothetical protein NIES4071_50850 [Calothrix sp. NIES-4071]|nr:hypothetical protein NIES4071_50850 [Calothrix sp. NIES-4071]BAZ59393.1 hypothetical protein NIES4105_50800 [Calothrix sp. NIES-4105]